jgi:hypothetical protein
MTERVSIIEGRDPVIFVAPHGADDTNTGIVAESAAYALRSYAVINRGWERNDKVDVFNDLANCNNIEHCHEDVVKDEFLDPIFRFRNRISRKFPYCYIFYIHGVGNDIRKRASDLELIIGYGNGSPASLTCYRWMKNCFINQCGLNGLTAYEGMAGGDYAGWSRRNLNQLYRKWYMDPSVFSLQIEIIYDIRSTKTQADITGERIATVVQEFILYSDWDEPHGFTTKEI